MTPSKGKILQIQNYSVNDGDGVRTIVFFAGCPLRCRWCANPEGYTPQNRIFYYRSLCTRCGRCMAVCPRHIGIDLNALGMREQCDGCGRCVKACFHRARRSTVTEMSVEEILGKIEKQIPFLSCSGGITYSGGECTMQKEFLSSLVDAVYDMGLDQAMETSGCFELSELAPVLDKIDLLFMDIKMMDPERHARWTGLSNERILRNISRIGQKREGLVIRIPLIMGVNGDDDNVRRTAAFVHRYLKKPQMELLPYHSYGTGKYEALGLPYPAEAFRRPEEEELHHLYRIIEDEGVEVVSYK